MLEARIIAVADVVKAMPSHRLYRPALGIDKAMEETARRKGLCTTLMSLTSVSDG
jgi:HD-GYP domain-containing protein (c-di-GMP phosphodiesterase class II)